MIASQNRLVVSEVDLTAQSPRLRRISTTFTTRCNLRCVYCPEGSHAEEWYGEMTPEMLQRIIDCAKDKKAYVDISFYGDSTFHERFGEFAGAIIDSGVELAITSNFARLLRDDEIAVVARCRTVAFSFDTPDRDDAKAIRKGLDLRSLLYNVIRVRAHCLEHGLPVPPFTLNAVLTDDTVGGLPSLIAFAASMGVQRVTGCEFGEQEGATTHMRNVADLRGEDLERAVASIDAAAELAKKLGVELVLSGEQRQRIQAAVEGRLSATRGSREGIQGKSWFYGNEVMELAPGMTRNCTEPWSGPIVNPKGDVHPCCARGTVMGIVDEKTSLNDVLNNEAYRKLRYSLLTGEGLDDECASCHLYAQVTPAALQARVASYFT